MFKVRSHCAMIRTSSLSVNGTILHCIKRLHFARVDSLGFSFWVLFPWVGRLWISVHIFWGGHVFSFFLSLCLAGKHLDQMEALHSTVFQRGFTGSHFGALTRPHLAVYHLTSCLYVAHFLVPMKSTLATAVCGKEGLLWFTVCTAQPCCHEKPGWQELAATGHISSAVGRRLKVSTQLFLFSLVVRLCLPCSASQC